MYLLYISFRAPFSYIMEQQEIGLEQLIQALPPQERLPVAALMALHEERSQLD